MPLRPALFIFALIMGTLVEVQNWPSASNQPDAGQSSLFDLASYALHGRPARQAMASPPEPGLFSGRPSSLPLADREPTTPPHAHARLRTGS